MDAKGMMTRRQLLAASAAVSLQAQTAKKPNILVILTDDLGYGDLSVMGAKDLRTPNIDKLFASSVRFDNFYANCPVCSPTRAALMTGMFSDRAGVPGVIRTDPANSWGYLRLDAKLLPAALKTAGYDTAIVGKWHLGLESPNTPTERGFDFFHGFLGDMMDDYYDHRRHGNNYMRKHKETIDPKGHATDLFTQWAVDYIKQPRTKPFFLYLAYNAPHTPVQPTPESLAKVMPGLSDKRAKLAALIEHMDEGVGKVLAAVPENTIVVFSSDNGGYLPSGATSGPLRDGKESMYEGGIRVPTCIRWPGKAPGVSKRIGVLMDLYPTLCKAAGAAIPSGLDGRDIWGPEVDRDLVWVRREGGGRYLGRDYYALRRGDWKLLQPDPFSPYELYNLASDPAEKNNVAGQQKKVVQELTAALSKHIQEAARIPWQKP